MSEQKTIVISVRLSPAVHAALSARAGNDRQPVTRMAALLIEDALGRKLVAAVVPLPEADSATQFPTRPVGALLKPPVRKDKR